MTISEIVCWLSIILLFHTYLGYPMLLRLLTGQVPPPRFPDRTEVSSVSVILAIRNAEALLPDKLESLLHTKMPPKKVEILIGSDASDDRTNIILKEYARKYVHIKIFYFEKRQGKGAILNRLAEEASNDLLCFTDVGFIFNQDTLTELLRPFADRSIGLTGAKVLNQSRENAAAYPEKQYFHTENHIKYREGVLWGVTMGAFGACYAIRKELFQPIPANFLVDDFFITMQVLRKGYKAIISPDAKCYEHTVHPARETFRRKVRIAAGNFQNLRYFCGLLWPPYKPVAFAFMSHKVLRWFSPLLLVACYVSTLLLWPVNHLYRITFIIQNGLILLILPDLILSHWHIRVKGLRFITHFLLLNAAVAAGFIKYVKGIKSNVWEPTKRR